MKRIRYTIILQVLFLTFVSCTKNKKTNYKKDFENTEKFKTISIDIDNEEKVLKVSEYIANIDFVKLESNINCLIGAINKIEVHNNYIYILDRSISKSLFVFKKNGEFVKKIGKKGKGPGEYITIWDFFILDDNKLIISDISQQKIMFYDNFNFTHFKRIKYMTESVVKNDSLFYFNLFAQNNTTDLVIKNYKFKTIKEKFIGLPNNKHLLTGINSFRNYKDSITYVRRFENKIYRLKGLKLMPKFYFDFGDKKMTYQATKFSNSEDLNNIPYLFTDYYESKKYIVFTFSYKNNISTCLYNKTTEELKHSKVVLNDIVKGSPNPQYINNNDESIFGLIEASDLMGMDKVVKKKYGLTDIKETDNPIITFSYFK